MQCLWQCHRNRTVASVGTANRLSCECASVCSGLALPFARHGDRALCACNYNLTVGMPCAGLPPGFHAKPNTGAHRVARADYVLQAVDGSRIVYERQAPRLWCRHECAQNAQRKSYGKRVVALVCFFFRMTINNGVVLSHSVGTAGVRRDETSGRPRTVGREVQWTWGQTCGLAPRERV